MRVGKSTNISQPRIDKMTNRHNYTIDECGPSEIKKGPHRQYRLIQCDLKYSYSIQNVTQAQGFYPMHRSILKTNSKSGPFYTKVS